METSTLGISLGTKQSGVAVLSTKELHSSKVHSFHGRWSEEKICSIIRMIEKYLTEYYIGRIVIKMPRPSYQSEAIQQLLDRITDRASVDNCTVHYITINDIKTREPQIKTRRDLRLMVVGRYPELTTAMRKDEKNKYHYYTKLFESILAAEIGQQLHST